MPVRETLFLDLSQALGQIDDLERELDALFQPIVIPVDIETDQALGQLQRDIRAVDNDNIDVDVNVEGVNAAERSIGRLADEFDDAEESAEGYARAVDKAEDETDKLGRTGTTAFGGLSKSLVGLAAAFGGIAALRGVADFFGDAIESASNLEESTSKAQVVFGEFFGDIQRFASTAPAALGLANSAALEFSGTLGNLFTALGLTQQAAADLAPDIVQLGADLASFNNIEVTEALDKLRAGLVGEAEPLRGLGVNLNAATVEAKALELGLGGVTGEIDDAAKVQARYALILEQTATAQGDFARTADGIANTQRTLGAEFENLRASVGEALLPAFGDLLSAGRDLLPVLEAFIPVLSFFIDVVSDAVAPLGPFVDGVKALVKPITDVADAINEIDTSDINTSGLDAVSDSARDLADLGDPINEVIRLVQTGFDAASFRDAFSELGRSIQAGVAPLDAARAALTQFNSEGTITAEVLTAVLDSTNLTISELRQLEASAREGDLGFLTPRNLETIITGLRELGDGVDPADTALRNLVSGFQTVGDASFLTGQALEDVEDIIATTAGSADVLTGFLDSIDIGGEALQDQVDNISGIFDALPDELGAVREALKDEEGEIVTDFGVFLSELEEELAARQAFQTNIELLRRLGFDDLAAEFAAIGLDSAQALADGLANPAELARAEAALDRFAAEADLAYARAISDAVAEGTSSISELITAIQSVDGLTSQAQIDVLFRSIGSAGDLAIARAAVAGAPVGTQQGGGTVVNQTFTATPTPNTQTERAAQAANAIISQR